MPRIDPQQLLNCLQVLLSPSGGILSRNEVQRLANLMTKFSKKLVSKCIYVLILKNTDRQLLGAFMGEGGWNLIHLWMQDAHTGKNWALVSEILELLLNTPVDVERLKMNNLPKLIKGLTKRDDLPGVQQLATSLVEDWLTIVKGVTKQEHEQQQALLHNQHYITQDQDMGTGVIDDDAMDIDETIRSDTNTIVSENGVDTVLRMKIIREGKKVISRVVAISDNIEAAAADATDAPLADGKPEDSEETDKENSDKKAVPKKSSSSSSSSTSKSNHSNSRDKDKSKDRSKSSSSSRSKSSSRDKDRDRKDRDKDKHKHNGSSSSSSSSSSKHRSSSSSSHKSSSSSKDKKDSKEKQAEKDKDTLAKIQPQTLQKIGRIPRKADDKKDERKEVKKPTYSVEVRKNNEEKPKTVKVYNSKMRSTGLLEEAKPPPPRSATKKTTPAPAIPATIAAPKRPSPIRDAIPPPEKKSRLIEPEKGIKLIPPKPKPSVLHESDIFMDALAKSAVTKKEPKKRKRRPSTSKDSSPPSSPSTTKQPTSPTGLKTITPVANFYQDTLVTENDDENKAKDENTEATEEDENKMEVAGTPTEQDEETVESSTKTDANGLKGVLSHGKRKGPKRSIRWRPDSELVEVQYFELDETERVNVMKPFMDMQRMEMSSEREALRMRKLPNEDVMDTQTTWRCLIELDLPDAPVDIGSKSLEKNIQFAREKTVLQAFYMNSRIPDCPAEPDHESHPMVNPIVIPLEDPDHPDQDTPVQPWPEPKGSPPHVPATTPSLFNNIQPPAFLQAPPNAFQPNGLPQFQPPFVPPNLMNRPPADWNMIPNGIPPNLPPPELMQQGPPIFEGFGPQGPMPDGAFVPPFANGPNGPIPQLFPPNNFNNMRGRGGFRRGMPNNNGPWLRMGAPPNPAWNNQNRGRGFCNSFKKNGFCRNRDNCPYIH